LLVNDSPLDEILAAQRDYLTALGVSGSMVQ
jgi:hypothetical protein